MEKTKNFKLTVSYDGTSFRGWQKLPGTDSETVQGRLEKVASLLSGCETAVNGAGRTDAGVHAIGQVANVRLPGELSCTEIRDYFNRYLPETVRVVSCEEASDRFHARLSAKAKTYEYYFTTGEKPPVFERKYVYRHPSAVDVSKMDDACRLLIGTHDMKGFATAVPKKKSSVRTITGASVSSADGFGLFGHGNAPDVYVIKLTGDGFLYNEVRIIAGTLLEIGSGAMDASNITKALETGDRHFAGFTAPASGLFLAKVYY